MTVDRREVLRKIKKLGAQGAHFQSGQIRVALGVETNDKLNVRRVHSYFHTFEKEGIIAKVPGKRKRNAYYSIADEQKLRDQIVWGAPSADVKEGRSQTSAPDKIARIAAKVDSIEDQVEILNDKMSKLLAMWE